MYIKTTLIIVTLIIIVLFVFGLNQVIDRYEKNECSNWYKQIKNDSNTKFASWQLKQCKHHNIDLTSTK